MKHPYWLEIKHLSKFTLTQDYINRAFNNWAMESKSTLELSKRLESPHAKYILLSEMLISVNATTCPPIAFLFSGHCTESGLFFVYLKKIVRSTFYCIIFIHENAKEFGQHWLYGCHMDVIPTAFWNSDNAASIILWITYCHQTITAISFF